MLNDEQISYFESTLTVRYQDKAEVEYVYSMAQTIVRELRQLRVENERLKKAGNCIVDCLNLMIRLDEVMGVDRSDERNAIIQWNRCV